MNNPDISSVTDNLTLGNTVISQSIGVAEQSQGLNGLDGILGLGPVGLTAGTLASEPQTTIATVTDVSNPRVNQIISFPR